MSGHRQAWRASMLPIYPTPELELVHGEGAHVTDAAGDTYLDLLAGLAVNALGHAHPHVREAITDQAGELAHVSNLYATQPALELADRLSQRAGGHQVALLNSGSEANELAYKIARRHAHANDQPEARVLAFEGSFHGRTTAALGLTAQPGKQEGFGPFPDVIEHVPFEDPDALEAAFEEGPVAAVFAEYVQGEGGVRPMPEATAGTLHRLVDEHDALLVADEVQTGLGRTGRFFAHEHYDADPDIVTMAKALGGGLPASACLTREDLAELMEPGSHGCTFGANPVACAAANAVLDVYEERNLGKRAARLGAKLLTELEAALDGPAPRGEGLLVGIPLEAPVAGEVRAHLREEGVLVGTAGEDVVRLSPPLVVDEHELLGAVEPIRQAIQAATS